MKITTFTTEEIEARLGSDTLFAVPAFESKAESETFLAGQRRIKSALKQSLTKALGDDEPPFFHVEENASPSFRLDLHLYIGCIVPELVLVLARLMEQFDRKFTLVVALYDSPAVPANDPVGRMFFNQDELGVEKSALNNGQVYRAVIKFKSFSRPSKQSQISPFKIYSHATEDLDRKNRKGLFSRNMIFIDESEQETFSDGQLDLINKLITLLEEQIPGAAGKHFSEQPFYVIEDTWPNTGMSLELNSDYLSIHLLVALIAFLRANNADYTVFTSLFDGSMEGADFIGRFFLEVDRLHVEKCVLKNAAVFKVLKEFEKLVASKG